MFLIGKLTRVEYWLQVMVKPGLNLTLVGPEGGKSGDNTAEFTNITAEKNVYYTLYNTYIYCIIELFYV